MIYRIRNGDRMLDQPEVIKVVKLAISYQMLGEKELMDELYKDFKQRIPKAGNEADSIKALILTWDGIYKKDFIDIKDINAVEEIAKKVAMIK